MNIDIFIDFFHTPAANATKEQPDPNHHDYKEIQKLIRTQLSGDRVKIFQQLDLLYKQLAILSIKKNLKYSDYLKTLNCLADAVRHSDPEKNSPPKNDWQEAILLVVKYKKSFIAYRDPHPVSFNDRVLEFARAHVGLEQHGVQFQVLNDDIYISKESHKTITAMIDSHCRLIGGRNLIKLLFDYLSTEFSSAPGRFVGLQKMLINGQPSKAEVPYGYLLALGAKHIGDNGVKDHNDQFVSLVTLCRDLTTIFEIQPYSQWDILHLPRHRLIRFIQESAWYDNIYNFSQIKGQYAKRILNRLTNAFIEKDLKSNNLRLKNINRVANTLIDLAKDKVTSTTNLSTIAKNSKIQQHIVKKIMDEFMSFKPNEVNPSLEFPPISNHIDYYFKPAIALKCDYFLYPKSVCALGALNSTLNAISSPNNIRSQQNDIILGYEVEDFLREQFKKKGIKIAFGAKRDNNGKEEYECDLIVDAPTTLFIFEIKKKALTRKAMSGEEISLLSDLANSLMFSHKQAMNIEFHLKNNQEIILEHKGTCTSVSLAGRKTKRISVSLNDFGVLQDKISLQKILEHAATTNFKHPDKEQDKQLNKWREYTTEIYRLAELNGEYGSKGHPFYDSYFMSISQILTMLDYSSGEQEFETAMLFLNSMTSGTRNFYKEFFYGRTLRLSDTHL